MKKLYSLVLMVIITVVGVSIIVDVLDESTNTANNDNWEYDDFKIIEGVTGATGSLELITNSDGITYVHAKDIGAGKYTVGPYSYQVSVKKAELDVIFITGQSNAAYIDGRTHDVDQMDPKPLLGEGYYLGFDHTYSKITDKATMRPFVDIDGTFAVGDKGPVICAEYTKLTGNKTYFVCGGIPGTSITTFNPTNGTTWEYMKNIVIPTAISAVNPEFFNINWCNQFIMIQGEQDRAMNIDDYKIHFMNFLNAMKNGELGISFNHCDMVVTTIRAEANARVAQIQLARENPDSITIAYDTYNFEPGDIGADQIHYTQTGDNRVGVALGTLLSEQNNSPSSIEKDAIKELLYFIPLLLVIGCVIVIISNLVIKK